MLKTIKNQVEYILNLHAAARNDDRELYKLLIKEFYDKHLVGVGYVHIDDFKLLPHFGAVVRVRAALQDGGSGRLLPTLPEVIARRFNQNKLQADIKGQLTLMR